MLDSSDTVTVNGGAFTVNIEDGMPKIYHPASSSDVDKDDNDKNSLVEDDNDSSSPG